MDLNLWSSGNWPFFYLQGHRKQHFLWKYGSQLEDAMKRQLRFMKIKEEFSWENQSWLQPSEILSCSIASETEEWLK